VRLLLDTHALLWWLLGDNALSAAAQAAVANEANQTFISAVTAWEIAIKHKQGRLPSAARLIVDLDDIIARQGFMELSITIRNAESAGGLPLFHKDPFDRMLIAQALAENLMLVSNEVIFDRYGALRLW
jgi:PIN domain nuclease of toxin-antitoxin system